MTILIVDEEIKNFQKICSIISKRKDLNDIIHTSQFAESMDAIEESEPSIIFINFRNSDKHIQLVTQIKRKPKKAVIIFYSEEPNDAMRAFDIGVQDFILLPFEKQRFYQSLDKAVMINEYFKLEQKAEKGRLSWNDRSYVKTLPVKLGNKTVFIKTEQIKYIIADRYYAEIHTGKKKHVIRESLTKLFNILPKDNYLRIHRSYIINIDYLKEIIHSEKSELDVRMDDGKLLHVSRSHHKSLVEKLAI